MLNTAYGANKKLLKVACYNYPPYMIDPSVNSAGEGINIEILRRVFKDKGVNLKIEWMPFSRAVLEVETNHFDAICALSRFNSKKIVLPKVSIAEARIAIWKKKNRELIYNGLDSLKGKNIGIISGFNYMGSSPKYQKLIDEKPSNVVKQSGNFVVKRLFKMLTTKRIDVLSINYEFASYTIGQKYIDSRYEIIDYHPKSTKGYIGFSPKMGLNQIYNTIYKEGIIKYRGTLFWKNIYKKYMNIKSSTKYNDQ